MMYYWISFLIIIGVIGRIIYCKKYFELNRKLLDYLEDNNFAIRHNSVSVTFSVTGAWSWNLFKFYANGESIILIDDYDLDLNKNSDLYAQTYLITTSDHLSKYPFELFRNVLLANSIDIDNKQNLVVKGNLKRQTILVNFPWTQSSSIFTLRIKKPNEKFDFEKTIKYIR